MKDIEKLSNAACSDGNCIFKVMPEMRKGMRTNGGCNCLSGLPLEKRLGVLALISLIESMKCCDNCKHYTDDDKLSTACNGLDNDECKGWEPV